MIELHKFINGEANYLSSIYLKKENEKWVRLILATCTATLQKI